jgi:hypothetical protein
VDFGKRVDYLLMKNESINEFTFGLASAAHARRMIQSANFK